jgi:hypothetical protein
MGNAPELWLPSGLKSRRRSPERVLGAEEARRYLDAKDGRRLREVAFLGLDSA